MTEHERTLIEEFALAHMDAHRNPSKMLSAHDPQTCKIITDECVIRMNRCHAADKAVFDLTLTDTTPTVIREFVEAELDKGCPMCWFSSATTTDHPDCTFKIDRWFRTRKNLIEFGVHLILAEI